jgi:Nucleoside diphosphate kinase
MVKPDGVQRGLVGQIIARFEAKGFQVKGLKMYQTPREVAEEHYKDLASKPFYGALVDYILSGPVVCIVRRRRRPRPPPPPLVCSFLCHSTVKCECRGLHLTGVRPSQPGSASHRFPAMHGILAAGRVPFSAMTATLYAQRLAHHCACATDSAAVINVVWYCRH